MRKSMSVVALAAALAAVTARPAAAQAPTPPTNLVTVVSGSTVTFSWTHSTGTFTHYVLEASTTPGGAPIVVFPTSVFTNAGKLTQLQPLVSFAGIGAGTYYVTLRGANGNELSAPSNEVQVVVGGCQAPAAPTEFTAIMRSGTVYMAWNAGSGAAPTGYDLIARVGGVPVAVFGVGPLDAGRLRFGGASNVGGVPPGTFDVSVRARNACGTSAESNVQQVNPAIESPARTPNPASGSRLPEFNWRDVALSLANEARSRGLMDASVSCPTRPGYSTDPNDGGAIEARKVNLNGYINFVVDRLRQIDQRFGYNAKTPRSGPPLNAIIAGDEIAYHYGPDASQGSPNTFLIDVLAGHCTFGREGADYRTFFDEFGRWTGAGRFDQQDEQQ